MTKNTIDMVAITPKKANAQNLTCFAAFVATAGIAIALILVACVLPTMMVVTEVVCWSSMALEAMSIGLGVIAYWVKKNAL